MNRLTSRQRKLLYFFLIVALAFPIYILGAPAAGDADAEGDVAGGVLAQMRADSELGETDLGALDPTSASMNLVLLGLRGVATNLLWLDALKQQDHKDWGQLRATVNSIIMLQPHYLKVWEFQGWNLAYNVSAQWDAVEDRYYWVKEGGKFMMRGSDRNRRYPELYWRVGRILGPKIGRSDEWRFFRKFFNPKEYPGDENAGDPEEKWEGSFDAELNPDGQDNYLAAKKWFHLANDEEAKPGRVQHMQMRLLFRSYPARSQFDYADALQREGKFEERTRLAWDEAFENWTTQYQWGVGGTIGYGQELFDTPGGKIRFEADFGPDRDDKIKALVAIAKASKQYPNTSEFHIRFWMRRYSGISNYPYWRERALTEKEPKMVIARRELYEGQQLVRRAEVVPTHYRINTDRCDCTKLKELGLPDTHLSVVKVLCEAKRPLRRLELLKEVGMKDSELSKVLVPLIHTRGFVQAVSEAQMVLESGMAKFEEVLKDHPAFNKEDNMLEEALMAQLYWRHILQLNGMQPPENYPLKKIWNEEQPRVPDVNDRFKREIGLQ